MFLEAVEDRESQSEAPPFGRTLLSTFRLFRDKRLCLLTLLPTYSGLQQGFLSGEYTRVGAAAAPAVTALVPLPRLHLEGHRASQGPGWEGQGVPGPARAEDVSQGTTPSTSGLTGLPESWVGAALLVPTTLQT